MNNINNMFNNKYSKLLTVVLIIIIIAVIALLVFLGIEAFNKYTLENDSQEAVSRFEEELNKTLENEQVEVNEVVPNVDLNTLENTSSSSGGSTVKYKGYDVIGTIQIPKLMLNTL